MTKQDCRAAAATALARVIDGGEALDAPLAGAIATTRPKDRALLQQLCYGSLRQYHRLDGILRQLLEKPLKPRDADIRALLIIGLHQLLDMRTPDHAAISATVDASRRLGKPWATGLVNGVLRRCLRESVALEAKLTESDRLAHPAWLLEALREAWPTHWENIVAANNQNPPMCLRVNRLVNTRDSYLNKLDRAGIKAVACELSEDGLRMLEAVDVNELPGFTAGEVSVQDEAAQLAAALLAPLPGDRILDACAAPGGKACHLLESEPGLGELVAMDSDPVRLARVEDNLARLGLEATLICGDAGSPPPELEQGRFDRILLDAPCSGSGVIRRHPDIKVLRRESDIAGFQRQQLRLLAGVWPLLRAGGRLLYVTCSVLPAENAACIQQFLEATPDACLEEMPASWGEPGQPGRQLPSRTDGPDGMYFVAISRRDQP